MDSCVVPHRSTSRAVLWLTAQIGRDAVLSESYGRRRNSRARALLYATYHAKYILTDANKSFYLPTLELYRPTNSTSPFTYLPSSVFPSFFLAKIYASFSVSTLESPHVPVALAVHTNPWHVGCTSADRSNKATLPL